VAFSSFVVKFCHGFEKQEHFGEKIYIKDWQ